MTDGDLRHHDADGDQPRVCVLAPSPLLSVTIEHRDEDADVHLHAGGQGPWVANMLAVLEMPTIVCGPFGGETGKVLAGLVEKDLVEVRVVEAGGSNGAQVEDRRTGELECVAEMLPSRLNRHEVDDLFNSVLAGALASSVTVLTGPADPRTVPADLFRRVAADVSALGLPVVADLSGEPLHAALKGGLSVLKVSSEDMVEDGLADSESVDDVVACIEKLSEHVADCVLVTRAGDPAIASYDGELHEVHVPPLEPVHHRGAGDSMTAGIAAARARGLDLEEAIRIGAAAGATNVTRHGLASARRDTIEQLAERIDIRPVRRRAAP